MIVKNIFHSLGIEKPSYIDVGAHDPFFLSNTAIFYKNGSNGVNIEPNPILFKRIAKHRKRDINLQIGIGASNEPLTFYVTDLSWSGTFSEKEVQALQSVPKAYRQKVIKKIPVEVRTLKFVIEKYCGGVFPDFLSLDTEGLDTTILNELHELSSLPKVICTELNDTSTSSESIGTVKQGREILEPLGYTLVMKTIVNAIFVRKDLWTAAMN